MTELRAGAINRVQSSIIGIASTAPAYSLAVTVGLLAASVGTAAPVALVLSAIPVVLVALCFRELNREEPDCGTTFAWSERSFGRNVGRMVGWTTVVACVLVMSNLAQASAIYSLELFGVESEGKFRQALLGIAFIGLMAWLAYRGITIAAKTQAILLGIEMVALAWFVVAAFSEADKFSWPDLTHSGGWGAAFLAAVFLYWGWDSSFSINEESDDPQETPGFAALAANAVLIVTYFLVAWSAVMWAGADKLAAVEDDDFFMLLAGSIMGTFGGKVLVGAVLVSALASTQTTILPTARTMLSMARRDAFPGDFAKISDKYQTPSVATWVFAGVSAVVYATLVIVSENVLFDSVAATAILVALYYMMTAVATIVYPYGVHGRPIQRKVIPVIAAAIFAVALVMAAFDVTTTSLIVAGVSLALGVVVMGSMKDHPTEKDANA